MVKNTNEHEKISREEREGPRRKRKKPLCLCALVDLFSIIHGRLYLKFYQFLFAIFIFYKNNQAVAFNK